jgi:hypothetical protein
MTAEMLGDCRVACGSSQYPGVGSFGRIAGYGFRSLLGSRSATGRLVCLSVERSQPESEERRLLSVK